MQRIPPGQVVSFRSDEGALCSGRVISSKIEQDQRVYTVEQFPDGYKVKVPEDKIKPITRK